MPKLQSCRHRSERFHIIAISPAIAGLMLAGPFSGLPLVVCGCLKIGYDLALLQMFRHTKPPEEIG